MKNDSLKLDMFFPDELLSTTSVNHDDSSIHIKMRSKTHSSKCPECGQETQIYHGTYLRKVQDLPILGKTARLHITAHEYVCNNESCSKVTFVEDFDGFLSYYGRMTERCADFICMLAMETSCEGCAYLRSNESSNQWRQRHPPFNQTFIVCSLSQNVEVSLVLMILHLKSDIHMERSL